jgi:hypothetical protein
MSDLFPDVVMPGAPVSARATGPVSHATDARTRLKAAAALVGGALVIGCVILGLRHLVADSRSPGRQIAKIALLPDTPPPPPPPKIEKKEEPRPEKPTPQQEIKPKEQPQEAAPLKMEGAAGNGPSAFQAGTVTQDYKGGTPVVGGTGDGTGLDRAQQRLYAGSVRQALHDELERQLGSDAPDVDAQVAVWITPEGHISRFELQGSPSERPPELQSAMQRVADVLQLPAPPGIVQPMRFRLSLHAAG